LLAQDILEYCSGHNLANVDVIGHSMGGKTAMLFSTLYPEKVDKLIIADIGPKFYPQHHQSILRGLNAVDFPKKPSRSDVEGTLSEYITDFGTRQFLMKSLYWQEPGQLAFRFNLGVFNKKLEEIGVALPHTSLFEKPTLFIRGGNSNYILDSDIESIRKHFPKATLETIPNAGHWLHAENPALFHELAISFFRGIK
jgi:pimeloyl-ACP methyl ester carboxylesterase